MVSTISLSAVRSSPSIEMSVNAGIHTRFLPLGATNPRAIAIDLIAWFKAPAPIACISTVPLSRITLAKAPATELGFDLAPTLSVYIKHLLIKYIKIFNY